MAKKTKKPKAKSNVVSIDKARKRKAKLAKRTPSKEMTPAQVDAKMVEYGKRWGVSAKDARHLSLVGFINRQDALDRYTKATGKPKRKTPKSAAAKVAKKPKARKATPPAVVAPPSEA